MSFVAAAVVGGIGLGVSTYGTIKAGEAAKEQGEAAAALGRQNAQAAQEMGQVKLEHQQRDAAKVIGSAQAQYSADGIDISQGSALDVINTSTAQAAQDSNQLQYETFAKTQSFLMGAQNDIAAGDAAQSGAYLSAAGGLLTGAASIYGGYSKANAPKT